MPKISQERLLARERGIVQAAARCLQRNGLEGTGMRDLYRAANLSPGAVYRYFSSKEELLAAVAAASPSIAEAALAATEEVDEPVRRLRALLAAAAAGPPSARLQIELQTAALRSPRIAAALRERREAGRLAITKVLSRPGGAPSRRLVDLVVELCEALARGRLLDPESDIEARAAGAAQLLVAELDRSTASEVG